jgi:hypothetical protein
MYADTTLEWLLPELQDWVLGRQEAVPDHLCPSTYLLCFSDLDAMRIVMRDCIRDMLAVLSEVKPTKGKLTPQQLVQLVAGPQAQLVARFYAMVMLQLAARRGWLAQQQQQDGEEGSPPVVTNIHSHWDLFQHACNSWQWNPRFWLQPLEPLLSQVGTVGEFVAKRPQLMEEVLAQVLEGVKEQLADANVSLNSPRALGLVACLQRWQQVQAAYEPACITGASPAAITAAEAALQQVVDNLQARRQAMAAAGQEGGPPSVAAPSAAAAAAGAVSQLTKEQAAQKLASLLAVAGMSSSSAPRPDPAVEVRDAVRCADQAALDYRQAAASAAASSSTGLRAPVSLGSQALLAAAAAGPGSSSSSDDGGGSDSPTTWHSLHSQPLLSFTQDPSQVVPGCSTSGGGANRLAGTVRSSVERQLQRVDLQQQRPVGERMVEKQQQGQCPPDMHAGEVAKKVLPHSSWEAELALCSKEEVDAAAALLGKGLIMARGRVWAPGRIEGAAYINAPSSKQVSMTTHLHQGSQHS